MICSKVDVPEAVRSPKRIASAHEAALLLGALPAEDRPQWATAFYAGRGAASCRRCASPTSTWARA